MAPKRKLAELGGVEVVSNVFRACVHYHEASLSRNIRGPRRGNKQRAIHDLNVIRTAAAEHATRADGLDAMRTSAKRLKETAAAEAGGIEEVGPAACRWARARAAFLVFPGGPVG